MLHFFKCVPHCKWLPPAMVLYNLSKEKNVNILNYNRKSNNDLVSVCMIHQLNHGHEKGIVTMVLMGFIKLNEVQWLTNN